MFKNPVHLSSLSGTGYTLNRYRKIPSQKNHEQYYKKNVYNDEFESPDSKQPLNTEEEGTPNNNN